MNNSIQANADVLSTDLSDSGDVSENTLSLNAASEAFNLLTKELSAATAKGDPDELNLVMRKLEQSSPNKRLAPAKPLTATTPTSQVTPKLRPVTPRRKPRPALPPADKDRWPASWGNQYRGIPNELIRNALFNIRHNEPRQRMDNAPIATLRNQIMLYTGEELRIRDEDVLAQIFHFQRDFRTGEPWIVSAIDFLSALGRSTGMRGYKELYEILLRLSKAHITIIRRDGSEEKVIIEAGTLLRLRIDHSSRGGPTSITISVNPETRGLWETLGYTLVDWEQRQCLRSPLAKYLHRFYSSHDAPFPYKVDTIRNLTGSAVDSLNKFRQLVRNALEALVEINFLDGFFIDSDDLVHVIRASRPSLEKG